MSKKEVRKRIVWILIEVFFGMALLGLLYLRNGIWYETNDDNYIIDILTGKITGTPSGKTIYNNPIFSEPVAWLYRIIPSIPWYGIIMMLSHLITVVLPIDALASRFEKEWKKLFAFAVGGVVFIASWRLHSRVQYTSTAALLAITGYVCLICYQKTSFKYVLFAILELVAYGMRPESMEMIQPIGMMALIGISLCDVSQKDKRNKYKTFIFVIATALIIVVCGKITYKLDYKNQEWQSALASNSARMVCSDYYGFPEYEDISEILVEERISKTQYEAYHQYLNIGWDYSNGVVEKIAEYSRQQNITTPNIGEILKWVLFDSYKYYSSGENRIVVAAWVMIVLAILLLHRPKYLIAVGAYFIGKIPVWGYIFFKGRMPERVLLPLYITELIIAAIIWVIIIENKKNEKKHLRKKILVSLSLCILTLLSLVSLKNNMSYLVSNNDTCDLLRCASESVGEYSNKDGASYVISDIVCANWKRKIFDCSGDIKTNYIYAGGWFAASPEYQAHTVDYLSNNDVYFITTGGVDELREGRELDFWKEEYGESPVLYDSLPSGMGIDYKVYKVTEVQDVVR